MWALISSFQVPASNSMSQTGHFFCFPSWVLLSDLTVCDLACFAFGWTEVCADFLFLCLVVVRELEFASVSVLSTFTRSAVLPELFTLLLFLDSFLLFVSLLEESDTELPLTSLCSSFTSGFDWHDSSNTTQSSSSSPDPDVALFASALSLLLASLLSLLLVPWERSDDEACCWELVSGWAKSSLAQASAEEAALGLKKLLMVRGGRRALARSLASTGLTSSTLAWLWRKGVSCDDAGGEDDDDADTWARRVGLPCWLATAICCLCTITWEHEKKHWDNRSFFIFLPSVCCCTDWLFDSIPTVRKHRMYSAKNEKAISIRPWYKNKTKTTTTKLTMI